MSLNTPTNGVISEGRGGGKGLVLLGAAAFAAALAVPEVIKRLPSPCPTPTEVACHIRLKENCALLNPGNENGIIPANDSQKAALEVARGVCLSILDAAPQCGKDYCTAATMTDNALNQLFDFPNKN